MLQFSIIFISIAIIAAIFAFTGLAGTLTWIAQIVFAVFFVIALMAFFSDRKI